MTQAISTIPITLESLQKRQENALKVERALLLVREGKKVENLSLYLNEILKLHQAAQETQKVLQDSKKRIPRGFKEKFVEHEKALQRIKDIVQPILQAAVRRPPLPLPKNPPWEGKLHKGETPLHWAVRHHDRDLALRLTLHGHPVTIPDDLGVTPLDEAALQKDEVMKYVLLHPDLVLDKEKEAQYSRGQQEIKQQLKDLKRVNFASLSPVCQAAIRGDLETLEQSQDLDSPDPKTGLRPLHYAILAGQTPVIKFLIENDTNPYALTPKRHSYLDYAIIAGNAGLYEEYLKLGLPFRLAKEEKRQDYLFASGILEQLLAKESAMRDPIGSPGLESKIWTGVNTVWTASKLLGAASGNDNLLGGILNSVAGYANGFHQFFISLPQAYEVVPKWMQTAYKIFGCSRLAFLFGSGATAILGSITPAFLIPTSLTSAANFVSSIANGETIQMISKASSIAFTGLALAGAARSFMKKIPAYFRTFSSRPKEVLKQAGLNLFNVGAQATMAYSNVASLIPLFQTGNPEPSS